jgi:hypothetical protein
MSQVTALHVKQSCGDLRNNQATYIHIKNSMVVFQEIKLGEGRDE